MGACMFKVFICIQAEDGKRDYKVTGVQTCALPISGLPAHLRQVTEVVAAQAVEPLLALARLPAELADGHAHHCEGEQIGRATCREWKQESLISVPHRLHIPPYMLTMMIIFYPI